MSHNCLAYWGDQVGALNPKLDQGYNDPQGGPGWATRLALKSEYDALSLLKNRLQAASNPPPPALKPPQPWMGGAIGVNLLLDATLNVIGGLEGDRLSVTLPAVEHHTLPSPPQWHNTGVPDATSITQMNQLWGRVRNALGC
jgi:hypothetical protein